MTARRVCGSDEVVDRAQTTGPAEVVGLAQTTGPDEVLGVAETTGLAEDVGAAETGASDAVGAMPPDDGRPGRAPSSIPPWARAVDEVTRNAVALRPVPADEVEEPDDLTPEEQEAWGPVPRRRPSATRTPAEALAHDLGLALCAYRRSRGWTQARLGRRLGMDQPAVSRLEHGARALSIDEVVRLAVECGASVSLQIAPAPSRGESGPRFGVPVDAPLRGGGTARVHVATSRARGRRSAWIS